MSTFSALGESAPAGGNLPHMTVSELSQAVKRVVEGSFERVRVRGEVSGFKRAASGHLYLALKDENAVIDGVCWRGVAGRLAMQPEDGMEVIATGRLTTYAGRSKYQIVIDGLELAGEGALLKLLEERRRKLAAEGLFDERRKRPLPYLPEVIGVVTSPTGAVIRDILHRLSDRFPAPGSAVARLGAGRRRGGADCRCDRGIQPDSQGWTGCPGPTSSSSPGAAGRSRICGRSTRRSWCGRRPSPKSR